VSYGVLGTFAVYHQSIAYVYANVQQVKVYQSASSFLSYRVAGTFAIYLTPYDAYVTVYTLSRKPLSKKIHSM
jgi:hypothetical protein